LTGFLEERDAGVVTFTLNRPERLNAVTEQMMRALAGRLAEVAKDASVGVVVLTGAGRAFCVGGDIKDMEDNPVPRDFDYRVDRLMSMQQVAVLLRTMPKVTIAAINGPAMGAGLSMALACDMRISARSARFSTSFVKVGLSGDFGGSHTLQRLIGIARARELYYTGRTVEAEEAERIGLAGRLVDDNDLATEAAALARGIAAGPRVALGYIKANLLAAETAGFEAMISMEAEHQTRCSLTHDHGEAKRSFIEKRPPNFQGR